MNGEHSNLDNVVIDQLIEGEISPSHIQQNNQEAENKKNMPGLYEQ